MPIFNLPVEWVETILDDLDPGACEFEPGALRAWLRDHSDLTLIRVGQGIHTTDHVVPNYTDDYDLACWRCEFAQVNVSSRNPMRRELRISVPAPTKLPLP